ncbi:conserved exported hypothetical protein [Flavobacterium sp. 9AF]|uniref:alpha-2-macroglobulin family protein n=1 Tax=Flavobacterium sp. 9AF TaxID=2653142 RepID=UPI0012F0D224|nr:MG2 domain-containing protein [Flavobacterium sp. 9AF]VXB45986.1 conserved exported hypothetical protein [Flavobacterium sp. 9AF]
MKKYFILTLLFLNSYLSAQIEFEKEWQAVYKYELDGKIKSAYEQVQNIYKKAKRKENATQTIKTFFYISKFTQQLEEDSQLKIIENLTKELETADETSKAIYHYIFASFLNEYLSKNRYNTNKTTDVTNDNEANFLLWSVYKLEREIQNHYDYSLTNIPILIQKNILDYKDIFIISPDIDGKNYSLYDFLWNKNFDYFKKDVNYWTIKNTSLDDKTLSSLYAPSPIFIDLPTERITNSAFKKVFILLQEYEKNSSKNKTEIYIDRLNYIHSLLHNEEFYIQNLKKLEKTTQDSFLLQEIKTNKANYLYNINRKNSEKNYYEEILQICDSVLHLKNNINALAEAERLKNNILEKELKIETKRILYNNEPSRAFIDYKNIDTISLHYFKIPKAFNNLKDLNTKDSIVFNFISKNKPVSTFKRILPSPKKYFQYTTEILLESMPIGDYLLVILPNNSKLENKNYEYTFLTVSNIAFISDSDSKNDYFYVSDRKTGQPLHNVIIKNNEETKKTDVLGKVSFKKKKFDKNNSKNPSSPIYFITHKDTLQSSYNKGWFYPETNSKEDEEEDEEFEAKAKVYFDRAIYRPGQKVYYKGILIQNKKKQKSVVPFVTVLVTIEDSEYNTLKEYEVQTNEFGSFTGEFDLPKNILTGQFTLTVDEPDNYENDKKYYNKKEEEHSFWDIVDFDYDSNFHFQVEEYKRPTFEVVFETIKENYTIGDTLKIIGHAKTLAGSNLTQAKVNYTIEKNVYKEEYTPDSKRKNTIATLETDAQGKFIVKIIANDSIINQKQIEKIMYTINAEVIDTNGETRIASKTIEVGKKMLNLQLNLNNLILHKEDMNTLKIEATTLNNYPIDAKGNLYLSFIDKKKFLKDRQFNFPETQTISEQEFRELFPYEPYDNDQLNTNEKTIKTIPFDTKNEKIVPLDFLKELEDGSYKVIAKAFDHNGNEITTINHFELKSRKNIFDESVLFTFKDITNPQNDYFEFEFNSVIPNLYIFSRLYIGKNLNTEQSIQLKNNKAILKIKKEQNLNNEDFNFHFSTHYDNEIFTKIYSVSKEQMAKKLDFEIVSLRNKIEPGSKESWSFKIANQQLETEILASMYDSSLDQFLQRDWDTNLHFYSNYNSPDYPSFQNYNKINIYFNKFQQYFKYYNYYIKNPDLKTFGFNFNDSDDKYIKEKYLKSIQPLATVPKNAKTITGTVYDALGPLAGANIIVQGTNRGTTSDFDGNFSIQAEENEIISISYVSMIDSYYTVKSKNEIISITLENDVSSLESVVVVGYGTTKSVSLTSTSTTVIQDSIPQDAKFISILSGMVQGVQVQESLKGNTSVIIRGYNSIGESSQPLYIIDGTPVTFEEFSKLTVGDIGNFTVLKDVSATALYGNRASGGAIVITTKKALKEVTQVKTRTNFNETAFFYPQLKTDKEGKITFDFTTPESLTRWKLRLLGHNKNFETGYFQSDIVSQKDLMVMPNLPRFVREKDTIRLVSKIVNMTNETKTGIAMLLLFDAVNGKPIDSISYNFPNNRNFICKPKESVSVSWTITIPENLKGLQYKIMAKSGNFSDGEENILPVLSNKILLTETIPLWIREKSKNEYFLENLKNNTSPTLKNHCLTLEYTSNPVWFALQSLPYLMEFEHECAEQTFARYYANALAAEIVFKNPKIVTLFEYYRNNKNTNNKLKINDELKSILLSETPWFFEGDNEDEKRKQLAHLFDTVMLQSNQEQILKKIHEKLLPSGGFSWFDGGEVNFFITQHILSGMGHLNTLIPSEKSKFKEIVSKSLPFLDENFINQYDNSKKTCNPNSFLDIHYLYTRSFYVKDYPLSPKLQTAITLQLDQIKKNWLAYSLYQKAQLSLIFSRFSDLEMAKKIIVHLKESASFNNEIGMYWISNTKSMYWHQSQIETQALLIEAFHEVANDQKSIDLMKVWLLKNKQNKNWHTTKATSEAIYALLLKGNDWTSVKDKTTFTIGNKKIAQNKLAEQEKELETGYLKLNWKENEITSEMASIEIENKSETPGYGGIYWQYFENLENIVESNSKSVSITKSLLKKDKTPDGNVLHSLDKENLKIGDIVTIKLKITTTEDLEFVHLKDLRASCFEPLDVISKQERLNDLYYYKSTKDVASHFFFDKINKGVYILEYDVRVNNSGFFNDGVATVQSMYAPEFSAHSKTAQIKIVK